MKIINKKIIFNLSSTRVSAGLIYFDENKKKVIVDNLVEERIEYPKNNAELFEKNTILALDKVSTRLISETELFNANFILEDISIFLSQPWVEYETYTLKDESFENFELNNEYLNRFFSQRNIYTDKDMIRSDTLSVKLNDYFVSESSILNKKVKKIEVNSLDSYILNSHKTFLKAIINTHFPLLKVNFYPFLPTLFSSIETFFGLNHDFLFLDFTSEILELGLFTDYKIDNMISFPFGKNKLISKIMENNNVDFLEARSILKMYLTDALEKKEVEKIEKIFTSFAKSLSNEIKENILEKKYLERDVYVVNMDLETRLILKKMNIFKNLVFIDKNILNDLVIFKNTAIWDNFFALESKYKIFG